MNNASHCVHAFISLTLLRATAQYCVTATCTNDHCIHVFSYTTNICVANNTIIVKRKSPFPCHIRGVAYTKSISCNTEAHARYQNIQLALPAKELMCWLDLIFINAVEIRSCRDIAHGSIVM